MRSNDKDTLIQLYRRIGTYVEVSEDEIKVYSNGLSSSGRPSGSPVVFENDLMKQFDEKKKNTDFVSVFDGIATRRPILKQMSIVDVSTPFD